MTYRWQHFSGIDWDHRTRQKSIYKFVGPDTNGWADDVDRENGNYDYLYSRKPIH
jgi:alpha-amylase